MGLILDSSVLIAGERRGETVKQVIRRIGAEVGDVESAISSVTIVELTHGIYRAKTDAVRQRRIEFVDELARDVIVHPLTLAVALLAGRIEGELAAKGVSIEFEDLIIGTTALQLDFEVLTLNTRHFQLIPGLKIVSL